MAKFTHSNFILAVKPLRLSEDGRTAFLNAKGTVSVSIGGASLLVQTGKSRPINSFNTRAVVTAPNGAKVLPHFMRGEKVFVVMVEQFRIALRAVTLEAAGGEADEDDPRVSMARELEEEINLHVRSDRIKLVYTAFIQPPILTSKVFGGIVRISESDLPKELLGGEHQFGEFTVLTVRSLIPLLKSRDAGEFTFDLETSRLLDAVAEAVGLIERRY